MGEMCARTMCGRKFQDFHRLRSPKSAIHLWSFDSEVMVLHDQLHRKVACDV